jgi:dTDP-4-amino-4,6-dideoxygalactose transaminase
MELKELVIFGGKKKIETILELGQYNQPSWKEFNEIVDGIYSRKYYTNHGPLVRKLEEKLQEFLGVKHVMCMTNASIGLMIAAKALDIKGNVLVPAFSHVSMAQSVIWADLLPVFFDVDEFDYHLDIDNVEQNFSSSINAILAVNQFGGTCKIEKLDKLSELHNCKTYYYSADLFGANYNNKKYGQFGDLEVFSFHETDVLNASQGGCVCTNNDNLAARIRNIRSSYGSGPTVSIPYTGNGRMSEIQAGVALAVFDNLETIRLHNVRNYEQYKNRIENINGLTLYKPQQEVQGYFFNKIILEVDESILGLSAKKICEILNKEGIMASMMKGYSMNPERPFNHLKEFKNSSSLVDRIVELPIGSKITTNHIDFICDILSLLSKNNELITNNLK